MTIALIFAWVATLAALYAYASLRRELRRERAFSAGLNTAVSDLRRELSDARTRAHDLYQGGRQDGAGLERERIAIGLYAIPGLRCSDRDPHLRLSEVNAVVRGESVVVKRRKVRAVATPCTVDELHEPTGSVLVGTRMDGVLTVRAFTPDPLAVREGFDSGEGAEE